MKKLFIYFLLALAVPVTADAAETFSQDESFVLARATKLGRTNVPMFRRVKQISSITTCPKTCKECDDAGNCIECRTGYGIVGSAGATACSRCPTGCTACSGSNGSMKCHGCTAGYAMSYNSSGHSLCCLSGYTLGSNGSFCEPIGACQVPYGGSNFYRENGCTCPTGYGTNRSNTECVRCPEGCTSCSVYYGTTCNACEAGYTLKQYVSCSGSNGPPSGG